MPLSAETIEQLIHAHIPDAAVELTDLRGDGDHYAVTVTAPAFAGLPRIRQHKMVYDALEGKMGGDLHALSIKTREA